MEDTILKENMIKVTKKVERVGKTVFIKSENIDKIKKFKGFLEEDANSDKLKDLQEYVANKAIELYFSSDEFKEKINIALH